MIEAYLLIAGDDEHGVEAVAVYIGKQAGATKAAGALTLKRRNEPIGKREVRTAPIELVATDGAVR